MGPHIPSCLQVLWRRRTFLHPSACDCGFKLDQQDRRDRDHQARARHMVELGATISVAQVEKRIAVFDAYRAAKQYAAADQIRNLLLTFGVTLQSGPSSTAYTVHTGHSVRDYTGWEH